MAPGVSGLSLSLNNTGDVLVLRDDGGSEMDRVAWEGYEAGWTITAATGDSIERTDPTIDTDTVNDWSVTSPATPREGDTFVNTSPNLAVAGACPGQVTITATNMSPDASVAIITSDSLGSSTVPQGACAGADLGVGAFTFRGLWTSDSGGTLELTPTLPGGACGLHIVAFDVATCTRTNVTRIP